MSTDNANDVLKDIINDTPSPSKKWLRRIMIIGLLATIFVAFMIFSDNGGEPVKYVTTDVTRGRLIVIVSATGNLQPTNQVDIGSELSGTVEKVLVEENDQVKRGQVLAQLDLSRVRDQMIRSRAAVTAAEYGVIQAQATVAESRANLKRLQTVSRLSGGKVPSEFEIDAAVAALKRAEASEANALATVEQAQALLRSDTTNVAKGTIRSPINGIVLARKVEPGQTVAASLQAPVLFTIAENLSQMELQVDVDEADVGTIKPGQDAFFTVDAWPGRKYPATLTRVGFGAQTKDGVVSYKTTLQVQNADLSLRPGMTATAEITTSVSDNALLVPNGALRFTPSVYPRKKNKGLIARLLVRRPPKNLQKKTLSNSPRVWVLRGGNPVAIEVEPGLSDGLQTEILKGDLKTGMQVITETQQTPS